MFTGLELIFLSLVNEVEIGEEFSNNSATLLGSPIDLSNSNLVIEETLDTRELSSFKLKRQAEVQKKPSNPLMITIPQVNQQKPEEINGVFSILKLNDFQSSLSINSSSFKSQFALPLGIGWNVELKGNYNNLTVQPNWTTQSTFSLKKFINWFETTLSDAPSEASQSISNRGFQVIIPSQLDQKEINSSILDNSKNTEIDQIPQYLKNLDNSVQALSNHRISQQVKFSWDANLNNVSVGVTSPLPGALKDEIELRNSTNLSEVFISNLYQENQEQLQGTVSFKYRIAIKENMKLEFQNDYNFNNNNNSTFLRWIEKH